MVLVLAILMSVIELNEERERVEYYVSYMAINKVLHDTNI